MYINVHIKLHNTISWCTMWRVVTREEEGNWNIWHKKMQELNPNTSENYLLNSTSVCVYRHVCTYVWLTTHLILW
jgi:hypothetical protein